MNIAIELIQSWRLLARFRELINEPGVQQLIIRNENGDDLIAMKVPAMLEGSTIRPMLAAVKAIANELPRVTIAIVYNPELASAMGETDEFDGAMDVVEPVFERY
ncbi:DUF4342 domain-containing protein [Chloroflexus sp.]|uniref:DUF4342 domain-containing protein n=1 Tax=Chloroflexus sp. TaxID=1904827 RepID=UPI003D097F1F